MAAIALQINTICSDIDNKIAELKKNSKDYDGLLTLLDELSALTSEARSLSTTPVP